MYVCMYVCMYGWMNGWMDYHDLWYSPYPRTGELVYFAGENFS